MEEAGSTGTYVNS